MNGRKDLKSKKRPHNYSPKPITLKRKIRIVKNPTKNTMLPLIFPIKFKEIIIPFFVKKAMVPLNPTSNIKPTRKDIYE